MLAAALSIWAPGPKAASGGVAPEYQLKAAFLYHFLKFADWPTANTDSSLRILVAAPDAAAAAIRSSLTGKTVRSRSIVVQRLTTTDQVPSCELLFVAGMHRPEIAKLLERFRNQPVLTVGDDRWFRDAGGMIELRIVDQHVRIRINLGATEQAGVRLHPSVLTVADEVSRRPPLPAEAKQ